MSDGMVNRAIRYQVFPSESQKTLLAQAFGCSRFIYNAALNIQKGLYEAGMGAMSTYDLNNYCNKTLKSEFPFLRDVDKFCITNSIMNLQRARTNFFEGRAKHPVYKSKKGSQSYTTNATNNNIEIEFPSGKSHKGRIKLPKIKWLDACIYRRPGDGWTIKQATITKDSRGKYFVSILFAYQEEPAEKVVPTIEKTLGIDYSSLRFFVASDGTDANTPHYYRQAEHRLAVEQRRLSRMTRGSQNYERQKLRVSRLHERTANKRKNFCHQLSRKIANSYDVVCVEDLDLRALSGALRFGKATHDNGFGMFRTFLKYKLEEQGKHYVVIDKWYPSTKTCHCCGGYYSDVKLGQSSWACPHCGTELDRDINAAINIKNEGFRLLTSQVAS